MAIFTIIATSTGYWNFRIFNPFWGVRAWPIEIKLNRSWTFGNQMNHGSKITKIRFWTCSHRSIFIKFCKDVDLIIIYRIPLKKLGVCELIFEIWLQTQENTSKMVKILQKVDFRKIQWREQVKNWISVLLFEPFRGFFCDWCHKSKISR